MTNDEPNVWPFLGNGFQPPLAPIDMMTSANQKMIDQFSNWNHEANRFLAVRLEKDAKLQGMLAKADSPSKAVDAYAAFLREAAEDYLKEFSRMTDMLSDPGSWGITAISGFWPPMFGPQEPRADS